MDELDLNLKTAQQNQTRNVLNLKYKKENGDFPMATPPTSPQKFSPSVTSSPSILSATALVKTQPLPPHLTPTTPAKNATNTKKDNAMTPKRRSYMEAVSNSELNMNPMEVQTQIQIQMQTQTQIQICTKVKTDFFPRRRSLSAK